MTTEATQGNDAAPCYLAQPQAPDVPPGYKRTDAGVVPEDWRIGQLSALLTAGPKNGYSGRSGRDARGTPTLSLGATTSGRMLLTDETVKRLDETIEPGSDLFLRPGDVLVQRSNTADLVGTTAVYDGPEGIYVYPDLMMRMRFRDQTSAQWFWKYANSREGRRFFVSIAAGSSGSMPKISGAKLRTMPIPLPSTAEQRTIAEALSDVDGLLGALEAQIAKKRGIKQAAMQQLLTSKTRLPGFHDVWKVTCVGAEFHIDLGKMLDAEKNVGVLKPFVGNQAVQWGYVDTSDLGTVKLTPSDLHRYRLEVGDLLVCEGGEIGRAAIWKGELSGCYYQKALHRLRPKRDYDPRLMLHLLCHLAATGALLSYATQTSIAHLPKDRLDRIPIPRPSRSEQAAIASVLSDMDAEIAALEAGRNKTRAIKQGMMQLLLTGRVRLVEASALEAGA